MVAACRGSSSYKTGKWKAIQNKEDWSGASGLARLLCGRGVAQEGEQYSHSDGSNEMDEWGYWQCSTADGVVPLDLTCLSSQEARLGPAIAAYGHSGSSSDGWLLQEEQSHGRCVSIQNTVACRPGPLVSQRPFDQN